MLPVASPLLASLQTLWALKLEELELYEAWIHGGVRYAPARLSERWQRVAGRCVAIAHGHHKVASAASPMATQEVVRWRADRTAGALRKPPAEKGKWMVDELAAR